jgi:acetyl-CoA carboxylase biotin carboxyl carrier protein
MTGFNIDEAAIRKLAELLDETGLTEVEIKENERALRVSRASAMAVAAAPQVASIGAPTSMPAAAPAAAPISGTQVTSPMVGTVYLAGTPGAAPFVKAGDSVKQGDTLLIVEAMKVMNPIKAPKAGVISRILVSDAQPVEFGEPLMVIE